MRSAGRSYIDRRIISRLTCGAWREKDAITCGKDGDLPSRTGDDEEDDEKAPICCWCTAPPECAGASSTSKGTAGDADLDVCFRLTGWVCLPGFRSCSAAGGGGVMDDPMLWTTLTGTGNPNGSELGEKESCSGPWRVDVEETDRCGARPFLLRRACGPILPGMLGPGEAPSAASGRRPGRFPASLACGNGRACTGGKEGLSETMTCLMCWRDSQTSGGTKDDTLKAAVMGLERRSRRCMRRLPCGPAALPWLAMVSLIE